MKTYFSILVIIIISFLLFQNCSKDSPTEPVEKPPEVSASSTIGNGGGTLKTDNIEITIPAGAFNSTENLKIFKSAEENSFGTNLSSDLFVLDGLPQEILQPIKVKIKYSGTLSDSLFLAVGENNFISSLNEVKTCYHLIEAHDSAGTLIAYLPAITDQSLLKSSNASNVNDDKISINLGAIAGLVDYVSKEEHFKITFPASVLTQAYDLAGYLEKAYSKFKDIGFSYSNRTKWPIDVTIKRLSNSKSEVYGYTTNSMWGNNYGYMEFNFDKIDNAEEMKVTAGHEFFHLVQALYDPRYGYSKAKSPMPNYWLDEASSVWSEAFFSSIANYVSPIFSNNVFDVFKGAKTGNDKSQSEQYGYGMASFIKYITKKYGDSKLVEIYNNISDGKTPFQAVSSVLPIDVGFSWHRFLTSLISFNIYKSNTFRPPILSSYATGEHQKFIIKSASDSLATYKSKLSDCSATIFSVDNQFEKMSPNASLVFSCKAWNFQIYKINSTESIMLDSGKDTLTVNNFKKLTDEGYKIIAVLYNDDFDSPFTDKRDYEFKIRVVNPIEFNFIDFKISTQGTFTSEEIEGPKDSVWTYTSGTSISSSFSDPQVFTINGNYVTCSAQWVGQDGYVNNYQLNLVFNDINNPISINRFDLQYSITYNDGESVFSNDRSASGINIPLKAGFVEPTFRVDGNIKNNLLEYSDDSEGYYGIYNPPISSKRKLNSFETSNGSISFILKNN